MFSDLLVLNFRDNVSRHDTPKSFSEPSFCTNFRPIRHSPFISVFVSSSSDRMSPSSGSRPPAKRRNPRKTFHFSTLWQMCLTVNFAMLCSSWRPTALKLDLQSYTMPFTWNFGMWVSGSDHSLDLMVFAVSTPRGCFSSEKLRRFVKEC